MPCCEENKKMEAAWKKRRHEALVYIAISVALLLATVFIRIVACSREDEPNPVTPPPQPSPQGQACGDTPDGDAKIEACENGAEGERQYVCRAGTLRLIQDLCEKAQPPVCGATNFAAVKPIVEQKCGTCHAFADLDVAKSNIDKWLSRITLPISNNRHMPQRGAPNGDLSAEERAVFTQWKADGLQGPDDCASEPPPPPPVSLPGFDELESAALANLGSLSPDARRNAAFIDLTYLRDVPLAEAFANKLLSHVSTERKTVKVVPVTSLPGLFRYDTRDFGITKAKYELIEGEDKLDVDSFTDKGLLIKALTGKRKAIFQGDNLASIMAAGKVYYALTETPNLFSELVAKEGVDYEEDLRCDVDGADCSGRAFLVGFNGSVISTDGKNRLISWHESDDGFFTVTYDPLQLNGVPQRNLFQFPLLKETGGKAVFDFAASEVIYSGPNGTLRFALFNAAGVRQDEAPLEIVNSNGQDPHSPVIKNATSCFRCHYAGLLLVTDQVGPAFLGNPTADPNDSRIVRKLYRTDQPGYSQGQFRQDNIRYAAQLFALGIKAQDPDPISALLDDFFGDWGLERMADWLHVDREEFEIALRGSPIGSAELSPLLSGGTVTFAQFVASLPKLKADLFLFQQPL
jgi:hypothetical protein